MKTKSDILTKVKYSESVVYSEKAKTLRAVAAMFNRIGVQVDVVEQSGIEWLEMWERQK